MYNEEKNPGINWKDIIIKAIFFVIFLVLIVWLFPKVPNLKPFYSNIFRENIKYMQDAAESYYTNERLPKNIGDTAEMTLQEMINKKLILPFVDENGESCDTKNSYVQVKKNKNDYTLKVNLVCPSEKDYIEKTLGCYNYCDEEKCKKEETPEPQTNVTYTPSQVSYEYLYRRAVTSDKTTYKCPNGGTIVDGLCTVTKDNSYKATLTTTKGEEYCEKGGTLKDGKCYVTDGYYYSASTKSGAYYCPYGGELKGNVCYVKSKDTTYAATISYDCPNGGTLSGTNCVKDGTTSSYVASVTGYYCNGKLQSSSTCKTTGASKTYKATAKTTKKTIKTTTTRGYGYTLISAGYEYTCSNHILCPKRVYYYTYSYKETTYSCPQGGTRSGTTCTIAGKTTTSTATPKYECKNGGTLSGSNCIKTTNGTTYAANKTVKCPNGGTQNGNNCVISGSTTTYIASKATDEKYCSKGGTLTKDKCYVDTSYSYSASNKVGEKIYKCPQGGTLKGKNCEKLEVVKTYKPVTDTNTVTSYEYKWSSTPLGDGWVSTGEKRAK